MILSRSRGETTTVRFFEELYAVVVGLGLALAIEQIIDTGRSGIPVSLEHVPLFLAYLNFAFPLAHSSVRYLELGYIDRTEGAFGRGRVLADLSLGTGHFLFLIGLSFFVTHPVAFCAAAILLLIGRPGRDALVLLTGGKPLAFDRKVARVHLVTIGFLAITLVVARLVESDAELWIARLGTLAASLVFALGLYLSAFDYFFTSEEN